MPNAPRHRGPGHVESWFWRAHHPTEPRALWLKATILHPLEGPAVVDAWACLFDGVSGRRRALRARQDLGDSAVRLGTEELVWAGCHFVHPQRDRAGRLRGAIEDLSWTLEVVPEPAERLCLFPSERLLAGPFPRSKTLTPWPRLRFSGELRLGDERWQLDRWPGMQGHNWGPGHTPRYAWGHVRFAEREREVEADVEAVSARIRLGDRLSPWLSLMVVRAGGEEYRFDRIVDLWRQRARFGDLRWTLEMRSRRARARLELTAAAERMVLLGYENPDRTMAWCHNSKLARARLDLWPQGRPRRSWESAHGGALELLGPEPDPRVTCRA